LGSIIVAGMVVAWLYSLRLEISTNSVNLLDTDNFRQRLQKISSDISDKSTTEWQKAQTYAIESHQLCQAIVNQESILTTEILETLYTVLNLSEQVIHAILTLKQVKTERYRTLTRNHLQTSLDRLKTTHHNLQQLQDQVLLSSLDKNTVNTEFPLFLKTMIEENRSVVQTIIQDSTLVKENES
jgi:Fe-S cluster biosynthesis and repair protein YggX